MQQTRSIGERPTIEGNKIVGYAAVWNVVSPYLPERLAPGCLYWDDDVICTQEHNNSLLLGRLSAGSLNLESDDYGLKFIDSPAETTISNDCRALIRSGDLCGCSFTMFIEESHWEDGIEVITKAKLIEVGPVAQPAYPQTNVEMRKRPDFNEQQQQENLQRLEVLELLDKLIDMEQIQG